MWTIPQAPLSGSRRPPRFREWVAQTGMTGMDMELDVTAGDAGREVKMLRPKFQSAFKARPSVSSSRRSRSALSNIRAAYLGTNAEEGADDLVSTIAESVGRPASATSESTNTRLQRELAGLRTGDDAVKYFARHGDNSTVKVLYCNRQPDKDDSGSAACSLVIVPEHKIKPEHFTISANGVFHVCPGEMSECTPLSEWMHQNMMYSVLKSMPFFKLFAYHKNFQQWRRNARYEGFCRQRQRLSRSSFLAKPLFAAPLAKVHRLLTDVQELPLLLLSQETQRLTDFTCTQFEARSNPCTGAHVQIERKQDKISEILAEVVASVQQACAKAHASHGQSKHQSKSKSIVQEKQEAREQAQRLQICERDLESLESFIQLADFMFQGARVASVMDAALSFSKRLENGHRMFTVDVRFECDGLVLNPSREDFSRELARLWDGTLQSVSSVPSLTSSHQFKKHFASGYKNHQTVEEILQKCGMYKQRVDHIEEVIFEQLGAAEVSTNEQYMRYHHIYKFGEEWDENAFGREAHTFESLSGQIRLMSEFTGELAGFRLHRTCGVIHVNASGLRSMLEPIPERGLSATMRSLASLAHEKCVLTNQQLSTATKALDERCSTPQSVATYKVLCEATETQLLRSEEVMYNLEDAWRLLMKHGFRITAEDQLQLEVLRTRRRDLEEVKLPQAKAYLASLLMQQQQQNQSSPPPEPEIVVTLHASQGDTHDWSLTCEAGGQLRPAVSASVTIEEASVTIEEAPVESVASLLRRRASEERLLGRGGPPT